METDQHYFFEGLFIIVFAVAAAVFAVWLGSPGQRDDVVYRIHFPDSVSGLAVGDPVKFRGVDVGTVKSIAIDPENSRLVLVDVRLRKDNAGQDRHAREPRDERHHGRRLHRAQWRRPGGADPARRHARRQRPRNSLGKDRPPGHARRAAEAGREILGHRGPGQESRDERRRR